MLVLCGPNGLERGATAALLRFAGGFAGRKAPDDSPARLPLVPPEQTRARLNGGEVERSRRRRAPSPAAAGGCGARR